MKTKKWTKYELYREKLRGYQQDDQTKARVTNSRCQNQVQKIAYLGSVLIEGIMSDKES